MKYIVLRSFKSYGNYLRKGTIVDETEIRNKKLRISEKKIYPVVPSSNTAESSVDTVNESIEPQQVKEESKIEGVRLNFKPNKNLSLG